MNKRIRKKKYNSQLVICNYCDSYAEHWRDEEKGKCCLRCFADLVGLEVSEVWGSIE
ncbi:hypothetical protein [Bacillus infantis]|uniref:hypothetical protein n=1 Tax=Bacillus infantis TaxID=324767 RepID=UPI0013EB4F53|nr:hypothetical protein [Bacillus infantis]